MNTSVAKPRVRVKAVTKVEGQTTPGPWFLPVSGGWLPAPVGDSWNWWQNGFDLATLTPSAVAEACISAYAQTVAMCPGTHWKLNETTDGRECIKTSALSRVLKKPNEYMSNSDFMLNAVSQLYSTGNAYALALRNNRNEIVELHLMNSMASCPIIGEEGSIFYNLGGNEIVDRMFTHYPLMVPARDVLHLRLKTRRYNQLLGESPILSAARDIAATDAIARQQLNFYLNQARPSAVLSTDMTLDAKQVQEARDRWDEQTKGSGAGGTPILTANLKPMALPTMTAEDSQLVEIMKMNEQHIALAFRIPLQILGIGGTTFNSTELLMQSWLAGSLGFCLNHIEEAVGNLFRLDGYPEEYVEYDTMALLRSAFKDRIDSLTKAVQGGILAPNEARASEGYKKVKFGDEPRVQQQVVPLSAAGAIPATPAAPAAPPAAPVSDKLPAAADEKDYLDEPEDTAGEDVETLVYERWATSGFGERADGSGSDNDQFDLAGVPIAGRQRLIGFSPNRSRT